MRTIKKYSNRRLYDTSKSSYITLEELAETIRDGEDVRVVDAKSGEDLTQGVLAQIILESRGASSLLPVPLLTQLIRMKDDALSEFFGRYMSWALEIYQLARRNAESLTPYNPLAHLPFDAAGSLARLFTTRPPWLDEDAPFDPRGRPAGGDTPGRDIPAESGRPREPREASRREGQDRDVQADEERDRDVAELRREIKELKAMVRDAVRAEPHGLDHEE